MSRVPEGIEGKCGTIFSNVVPLPYIQTYVFMFCIVAFRTDTTWNMKTKLG